MLNEVSTEANPRQMLKVHKSKIHKHRYIQVRNLYFRKVKCGCECMCNVSGVYMSAPVGMWEYKDCIKVCVQGWVHVCECVLCVVCESVCEHITNLMK